MASVYAGFIVRMRQEIIQQTVILAIGAAHASAPAVYHIVQVLMQQQNNRTDSMIIGIGQHTGNGAAHVGAPAVYYMGAV